MVLRVAQPLAPQIGFHDPAVESLANSCITINSISSSTSSIGLV